MSFEEKLAAANNKFRQEIMEKDPDDMDEWFADTTGDWDAEIGSMDLTEDQRAVYDEALKLAEAKFNEVTEEIGQGQALSDKICSTCEKEFPAAEMKVGDDGMPYCRKHYTSKEGCFAMGTLMMKMADGAIEDTPIEALMPGDKLVAVDDSGSLAIKTVLFTDSFAPVMRAMTRISLASGKTVETTAHHKMCVWASNTLVLKRADEVEVGDCFKSTTAYALNQLAQDDTVIGIDNFETKEGVAHVIADGHVVANGIAVSCRCDGDVPDLAFMLALAVANYFGARVSPAMHFVDKVNK